MPIAQFDPQGLGRSIGGALQGSEPIFGQESGQPTLPPWLAKLLSLLHSSTPDIPFGGPAITLSEGTLGKLSQRGIGRIMDNLIPYIAKNKEASPILGEMSQIARASNLDIPDKRFLSLMKMVQDQDVMFGEPEIFSKVRSPQNVRIERALMKEKLPPTMTTDQSMVMDRMSRMGRTNNPIFRSEADQTLLEQQVGEIARSPEAQVQRIPEGVSGRPGVPDTAPAAQVRINMTIDNIMQSLDIPRAQAQEFMNSLVQEGHSLTDILSLEGEELVQAFYAWRSRGRR